jgi:hypothetical protein
VRRVRPPQAPTEGSQEPHLDSFGEGHRAAAEDFLARAKQALKSRHAVLHGLWPFPQQLVPDEPARGWRNAPPGARARKDWPVEWTDLSADDLPALARELNDLVREVMDRVETWAQQGRFGAQDRAGNGTQDRAG